MNFQENCAWANKHQNVKMTVGRMYDVWNRLPDGTKPATSLGRWQAGMESLMEILREAEQNSQCVRAVGGGWSLSAVACTDAYFVNTRPLNIIDVGLSPVNVEPGTDSSMLVLAQCGASVAEINEALRQQSLALPTTGGSDGQTIAGAMSTGTHGAAIHVGAMQDYARALHLITGSNEHFWIEGNQRVVSDNFINQVVPGAVRLNDDQIFRAAIVSFGSFGLIHAILLQAEPIFALEMFQDEHPWSAVKGCVNGPGNFPVLGLKADPHHFEVIINPYVTEKVIVRAMYKHAGMPQLPPEAEATIEQGPGADVLCLIGKLAGAIPAHIPTLMHLMDKLIKSEYPPLQGKHDIAANIFSGGHTSVGGAALSTEMGFDASDVEKVVGIILEVAQATPFPGIVALRYVKQSTAILAFTRFPVTCTIEIPASLCDETRQFYHELWKRLDSEGIDFSFHWGQCNNLDDSCIRKRWPDEAVDAWLDARSKVLRTPVQRHMFSNAFLHTCGLVEQVVV